MITLIKAKSKSAPTVMTSPIAAADIIIAPLNDWSLDKNFRKGLTFYTRSAIVEKVMY